jgi:nucleoside-diphosphate-sugar epimerase
MTKKIVLIAGGAGFLGSHLCDYYVDNDYEVVCIDNLSTGSEKNILHLHTSKNFTFFKADISNQLPDSITNKHYDIVANLASPASPPHYQRLAIETLMAGSIGTLNLLELANISKARFFQASTSEVYGDPDVHPQPESYRGNVNSYGPRSMYDEAKRFGEALTYSYRKKFKLSTCIARFFNTYGPRMDPQDGRVVSNFIVQTLENKPLTVYGDGSQTRSFCYVTDLIEGIVLLINSNEEGPINLGNPGEFTILKLAHIINKLTESDSPIIYKDLPTDDPTQRQPDIKKAKQKLLWEPKIPLKQGLENTIQYFKSIT